MVFLQLIKILCIFIGAVLLGNMFLEEVKKAKMAHKPWYAPYLTLPGILIIIAILLPVLIGIF